MDHTILHDVRRKAPGRGAHAHANQECLVNAQKHGFKRSFRADVKTDETFVDTIALGIERRVIESMRVAFRSKSAVAGASGVDDAFKKDAIQLLLIANDCGEATASKYAKNAERKGVAVTRNITGAAIGSSSGKAFVAVMGFSGAWAQKIHHDFEMLSGLGKIVDKVEANAKES